MMKQVEKAFEQNKWINGFYDYRDGDLMAMLNASEQFLDNVNEVKDTYRLFEYLKGDYTGTFVYKNLLIFNHWDYGTFIYCLNDVDKGYIEHLTMSAINYEEFVGYITKLCDECE